jgi:hypothetical protein
VRWVEATFRLPVAPNMPVEVALVDGTAEIRDKVTGDWREVVRWRTVLDADQKSKKKKG